MRGSGGALKVNSEDVEALSDQLETGEVALLRSVMADLYDFDEMDTYIDEHAQQFTEHDEESEQPLEWTVIHQNFVALVEGRIERKLAALGWEQRELHSLLQRSVAAPG